MHNLILRFNLFFKISKGPLCPSLFPFSVNITFFLTVYLLLQNEAHSLPFIRLHIYIFISLCLKNMYLENTVKLCGFLWFFPDAVGTGRCKHVFICLLLALPRWLHHCSKVFHNEQIWLYTLLCFFSGNKILEGYYLDIVIHWVNILIHSGCNSKTAYTSGSYTTDVWRWGSHRLR